MWTRARPRIVQRQISQPSEQAVGIVRMRYEMSEEQAMSALLRLSQDNIKMSGALVTRRRSGPPW